MRIKYGLIFEQGYGIIYIYNLCSMKEGSREKAIDLRKQGFTYSEILERIPVAKSTLSLWLRSVGLSKKHEQRITEKKLMSAKKGADIRRQQRIKKSEIIENRAKKEVGGISRKELLLIGVALYWAEGSKQKEHNISQKVAFSNSDPEMLKLFLYWLKHFAGVSDEKIYFELYIHESKKDNLENSIRHWTGCLNESREKIQAVYFKKNKINTKRKNIGKEYHGLIRINVRESTDLNRRISGWIQGILNSYK